MHSGVRSKVTVLPVPHITSIQPLHEMYSTVQNTNPRTHVSSSQGVTDVNNSHVMSTQSDIRPETTHSLFSQGLQMPQIQSHQGVGNQFNGTVDHVYFPASQGVMGQGTNTVGSGDSHSTELAGQGQGTVSQESADVVIPSLQALKNSAEINRKVSQRYQELEDSAHLEQGSLDVLLQSISQRIQKSQKLKVK